MVVVLFIAHVVSLLVSHFHVFHLTQTSVAILATQEEMVLIFCFGLFWMSVLLGWHSLRAQGQGANSWLAAGGGADDATMPVVDVRTRRMEGIAGQGQGVRPYPCAIDDAYCIVEEYTFF
ncbi:hypothetical protein B0H14DRAFT_609597 [Mycena olivaceomarginata]|nr:hypothetical protein B0H14DRAFT_609597 [Mycena olivaceomarginata]